MMLSQENILLLTKSWISMIKVWQGPLLLNVVSVLLIDLWKEGVNVCVINYTNNHILMKIVEDVSFAWFLTGFYGWPEASQKTKSLTLLNHIKSFVDGP